MFLDLQAWTARNRSFADVLKGAWNAAKASTYCRGR